MVTSLAFSARRLLLLGRAPSTTRLRPGSATFSTSSARSYANPLPIPLRSGATPSKGYGQPLPFSHPHLLKEGELSIGIQASEYEDRRRRLMDGLEPGAVVVVAGGRIKFMSANIFYKFRQASNMWYLTGWDEPNSALVLEKTSTTKGYRMTMFVPPRDPADEMWHGPRSGIEGATEVFGADQAFDSDHLASRLKSILSDSSSSFLSSSPPIYVDLPGVSPSSRTRTRPVTHSLFDYLNPTDKNSDADAVAAILAGHKGRTIKSAAAAIERLRVVKSAAEQAVMRAAADISCEAHGRVMRYCRPTSRETGEEGLGGVPVTEHGLVSQFQYVCGLRGAAREAYVPVCASGRSTLSIHYTANALPLVDGETVLLDAGCEYGGYASDITRCFPVNGTFTSPQRDLYEAVLRVEKACIEMCTVSHDVSLDDLHRKSVELTRTELRDLGFNLRAGELERTLYPHFLSHPLGVDLHDTPTFRRNEKLQAGMVITIEPGLYVPDFDSFPKHFRGMAMRVEDEVVVGQDDFVVLSVDAPKEVVDVEACCQGLLEARER